MKRILIASRGRHEQLAEPFRAELPEHEFGVDPSGPGEPPVFDAVDRAQGC